MDNHNLCWQPLENMNSQPSQALQHQESNGFKNFSDSGKLADNGFYCF